VVDSLQVNSVQDIRCALANAWLEEDFVTDKTGVKTIEILGAQFFADEPEIFGKINEDYIKREFEWYESEKLNVDNFPGGAPEFWLKSAGNDGYVNSNYGYLVYNVTNYQQFDNVVYELRYHPDSRRAVMIYNRPSIWNDFCMHGANDFICTMYSHYFIRKNKLETIVAMRSNDVVFGYKNDYAWQVLVRDHLFEELKELYPKLKKGSIIWNADSLHIYERHFYLLDYFSKTWTWHVTKSKYEEFIKNYNKGEDNYAETEKS
jgi:thymidylate synthase